MPRRLGVPSQSREGGHEGVCPEWDRDGSRQPGSERWHNVAVHAAQDRPETSGFSETAASYGEVPQLYTGAPVTQGTLVRFANFAKHANGGRPVRGVFTQPELSAFVEAVRERAGGGGSP